MFIITLAIHRCSRFGPIRPTQRRSNVCWLTWPVIAEIWGQAKMQSHLSLNTHPVTSERWLQTAAPFHFPLGGEVTQLSGGQSALRLPNWLSGYLASSPRTEEDTLLWDQTPLLPCPTWNSLMNAPDSHHHHLNTIIQSVFMLFLAYSFFSFFFAYSFYAECLRSNFEVVFPA